ncbi:MAG: OsmC family protein [Hydrogenophaga sp.]|uniref:OsmC family protein n=1 Tax=Hydrogenophaga sp. TaxID=1904254 RepID=UPI001DAFAA19|nr:OsmC family protein [Hydrogenophaga sp.]MBX3610878.1 OsmC family protein [Hydrogenophaga sp.]
MAEDAVNTITITIARQQGYQFLVDFGDSLPTIVADEPAPLGTGSGPSPNQLLLSAIANCLSASLLFALQKYKQDPGTLRATATATIGRNEARRLRVKQVDVALSLDKPAAELAHLDRVLAQFEDFCTVTQSVRQGFPVTVTVQDGSGKTLAVGEAG